MPTALRTEQVSTLQEFLARVQTERNRASEGLWFRGVGRNSYELSPSLFRHPAIRDIAGLMQSESELLLRFKQRSIPYLQRAVPGDWEFLFLMQHYGVPTRLLDWTENPFVALFFAITSADYEFVAGVKQYKEDAAVWLLAPTAWNRHSLRHMSYAGGPLSAQERQLNGYEPAADVAMMNNEPVALFGAHNSPRIVAQRGVFTIAGKDTSPMEATYASADFPADCLVKLTVPKGSLPSLEEEFFALGFTDSVVWPDLDGLGREIKRNFGFRM